MRKTIAVLLVAVFAAAGGRAMAADRAGISVEWGMGPTLVLGGGFSMLMDETAALNWDVSNDFSVSIFSGNSMWRGEYEYTNNGSPAIKHKMTAEGYRDHFGIAILHSLPVLSFLKVGIELGRMNIDESDVNYANSDGSTPLGVGDFGGSRDSINQTASMEGIVAKVTLLKGESKGTYADISVMGSLRFVQLPETAMYGTQETDHVPTTDRKAIDPIASFNNLSIKVVASLGF